MSNRRIYTFSVKQTETSNKDLVEEFKVRAIREHRNFSHYVLEGLKMLKAHGPKPEGVTNGH